MWPVWVRVNTRVVSKHAIEITVVLGHSARECKHWLSKTMGEPVITIEPGHDTNGT